MSITEIEEDRIAFLTEQRKANERMEEIRLTRDITPDLEREYNSLRQAYGTW